MRQFDIRNIRFHKPGSPAKPKLAKGQGLVEFALALPVFLFLMVGVIEFGWLLFVYSQTYTASQEAARYGAAVQNLGDCVGIVDAAVRVGHFGGVASGSNVQVYYDNSSASATDLAWNKDDPIPDDFRACDFIDYSNPESIQLGDRIVVQVSVNFVPLFGIIPRSTVVTAASRTVIKDVQVYASTP